MRPDEFFDERTPVWELSADQAHQLLVAFLAIGQTGIDELERARGAHKLDYSESSVVELLHEAVDDLQRGLLNEELATVRFGRLGYYFGQSLIRASPSLRWASGNTEFAFANLPVVVGFDGNEEAATVTICTNLVNAVFHEASPPSRIEKGVRHWFGKAVK